MCLFRNENPVLTAALLAATSTGSLSAAEPQDFEYFETKVRPLLVAKCQVCHNTQMKSGNIDLSSVEGFLKARDEAALVSAEDPDSSRLLAIVGYEHRVKMPPGGKLPEAEIAIFRDWLRQGAPWPGAEHREAMLAPGETGVFTEEQKNYWAFQPVTDPALPTVRNADWVLEPVDRFVLAKLEEQEIEPAPPTDKLTWLRRATFDLTGLPPTPAASRAFLMDESPEAHARVVERLLTSPAYGERWGRHWLDVARYADSTGNDEDHRYPYAWKYRDYVIESFNNDLPYDQFVREQIAGDLLPTSAPDGINRRGIVATGFLALGPKAVAQQDKQRMLYDVYDEQIEVVSKAMLGLTVACARCHDHKFDPILTRDYYSLAGIFASTRSFQDPSLHVSKLLYRPLVPRQEFERYEAQQRAIKNRQIELDNLADMEIETFIDSIANRTADYMLGAREVYEDDRDPAEIATERNLSPPLLEKWIAYLQPTGEPRRQLAAWRDAMASQRETVAGTYQKRFEATLKEWHHTIRRWRESAIDLIRNGSMPPPPKPNFVPGRDRFFHDVYGAKGGPLRFDGMERERLLRPETVQTIATLKVEIKELKANAMKEPPMANAIEEGPVVEQRVFVRGDYSAEGEPAPKVFPAIIAGFDQDPVSTGSGRLELANWIASPDNPLTARVMVNRIWQKHFGEGIVRTPSNFGKLGTPPTHPELLDWLATRFVEHGWSVKEMHRRIMLSNAYRMSSVVSGDAAMRDPSNQWLSRYNRRRLDVEELRDGMLAIDQSIDRAMGGTLQSGFGTDRENSNDRLSIDPTTSVRRMVYLPLRRANLPTLLNLFDFGDAVTSLGKRPVTNVAPQALFMMNSDFVQDRASNLAEQLLAHEAWTDSDRARRAYLRILTRDPDPDEIDGAVSYVSAYASRFDGATSQEAWQSYCRILLASNDFIYVD